MSTASQILAALALGPQSGNDLAEVFGVTRAGVWKAIQALRSEGVDIAADGGGYRLVSADGFGAHTLAHTCEREVVFHERTESTNRDAFRLALDGAPAGTLVVADVQSSGKGRLGRSWEGQPGESLLFSLVLRPPMAPTDAPKLCLAAALALAAVTGQHIKWPNDVVSEDGGKLAGILAEMHAEIDRLHFVVLGVGLNVHQAAFPPELPDATSLARLRRAEGRAALLGRVVSAIEARCAEVAITPDRVLADWKGRARTLGRRVRVGEIEGRAVDLRADGALIVDVGDRLVPVLTGDVQMVK
ncbi:MAG: biotin--[acetyl-CoA-carboxylase] ligase [Proteobacteria bacterium]|nr:biotin--[acetyl-CoA-carboxylase] ligase [Pseudomonadota bacterium]MCP4918831.1 biotin--[acetyl-CoA-carboxylase] ligase [Pseudomonadota bacterium]